MNGFRHRIGAALVVALAASASFANAETITVPFPSALPVTEHCLGAELLGWRPSRDTDTCRVLFPIAVPIGKTIRQITLLHGTTDYAATSDIVAALTVYPVTSPWQSATDEFTHDDPVVHTAFDVLAMPLMQQSGKVFPDAFVVGADDIYYVNATVSGSAL